MLMSICLYISIFYKNPKLYICPGPILRTPVWEPLVYNIYYHILPEYFVPQYTLRLVFKTSREGLTISHSTFLRFKVTTHRRKATNSYAKFSQFWYFVVWSSTHFKFVATDARGFILCYAIPNHVILVFLFVCNTCCVYYIITQNQIREMTWAF